MASQNDQAPPYDRDSKSVSEHVDDTELEKGGDRREHAVPADTDAAAYVDPDLVLSKEESTRLRRRIHKRVLPLLCLAYIVQAFDKGTLGPSSIMGWLEDVNAKGQDYALTSTFFWVGLIAAEPFANHLVQRLPVAKVLSCAMMIWTVLLFGLAFSFDMRPVFAIRVLLGISESVFGPCLLTITVQWYLVEEQPYIQTLWQSMLGFGGIIMSFLGWSFYHIKYHGKGLRNWQWLNVCIASFSFLSAVITFFFLADSPAKAKWATPEERTKFIERVRPNNQGIRQKVWKKAHALEALKDPYTYLMFCLALFNTLVVGGLGKFSALLINKAFGFDVLEALLLSMPLSLLLVILYWTAAWLIRKTGQTLLVLIGYCCINIIGTVVLITVPPAPHTKAGLLVTFYLMQSFQACNAAVFLMLSRNVAGQTKKSITYATTYMAWASGNAIAPQLFQARWAPRYVTTLQIHLGLYGCFIITALTMRWLLMSRNKKKIAAQAEKGLSEPTNARAFDDLTDIENPDFRYSI